MACIGSSAALTSRWVWRASLCPSLCAEGVDPRRNDHRSAPTHIGTCGAREIPIACHVSRCLLPPARAARQLDIYSSILLYNLYKECTPEVLRRCCSDDGNPPAEPAAQKLYEAGRAAAQRHKIVPAHGRGRGGHGGRVARSRGRGRGHGRARSGGDDESDNESDDEAADESNAEATASEDPGLDFDKAGDAASDAEDDLALSALQSALQVV
eukprot:364666-Chlamydomonas_euryale.AAC.7